MSENSAYHVGILVPELRAEQAQLYAFAGRYVDRFDLLEDAWRIGHRILVRD